MAEDEDAYGRSIRRGNDGVEVVGGKGGFVEDGVFGGVIFLYVKTIETPPLVQNGQV